MLPCARAVLRRALGPGDRDLKEPKLLYNSAAAAALILFSAVLSRALGDRDFKEPKQLLTCEPEVTVTILEAEHDQFTIFASDGIWNFVAEQEAVDLVAYVIEEVCCARSVLLCMVTLA